MVLAEDCCVLKLTVFLHPGTRRGSCFLAQSSGKGRNHDKGKSKVEQRSDTWSWHPTGAGEVERMSQRLSTGDFKPEKGVQEWC